MKKHVLYCAAAALCFAACSNHETDGLDNGGQPRNAVPIRIGQSVAGVTARGVIESGSDVTGTVLTANYSDSYAAGTVWNTFTPQTTNELTEDNPPKLKTAANVSSATFKAGTEETMNLNPALYYYAENKTAIVAIAPAGTVSGTNVVMKQVDGTQDVMYAAAQVESTPSAGSNTPVALNFTHKTTQLSFAFKLKEDLKGDWEDKSVSVKNITIVKARLPEYVQMADGTVYFSTEKELSIPHIGSPVISTVSTTVGHPVMVKESNNIELDIVLTVGGKEYPFYNIPVMGSTEGEKLTSVIGSAHLITLTVTEPVTPDGSIAIGTQATVTAWTPGEEGSGELK